jgi:hypothetical protein
MHHWHFQNYLLASHVFKINWAWLLSIAIFWLFAICGYPSGSVINENLLSIFIFFPYVYLIINYDSSYFHTTFEVKYSSIPYLIFFSFLAVLLSWDHLHQSLWGDQIYHASFAARHSQLFIYYTESKLPEVWSIIQNFPASYVVVAVNIFLLALLTIIFHIVPKINTSKYFLAFVMLVTMLSVRYLVENTDAFDGLAFPSMLNSFGIMDPHPLFRSFPLVITTSFFGGSDFAFRMASFLAYLLFLYFFFYRLKQVVDKSFALIATLAIGTIPIFWGISYLVEQSIWSTIGSSVIFTILATSQKLEEEPIVPLICIVILATFLRSPAFIGLIPIAFMFLFRIYRKTLQNKNENLSLVVLLSVLIIAVAVSALRGSPATETVGILDKLRYSLNNNIPAIAAASVLGFLPLFFIGSLLSFKSENRIVVSLAGALFLVVGVLLYYGPLNPQLWGVSRYQAEIFIPLIACGISIYCVDVNLYKLRFNALKFLPIFLFIVVNVFSLKNIDGRTFKPFSDAPPPTEGIKAEIEYPLKQLYRYVESNGLKNNLYYVGIYYGGFVSALGGYSAKDYLSFSRLNQLYRYGWEVNSEKLNADLEIKAVVIEPEANFGVTDKLLALGWVKTSSFIHARSKHELILLTRNVVN